MKVCKALLVGLAVFALGCRASDVLEDVQDLFQMRIDSLKQVYDKEREELMATILQQKLAGTENSCLNGASQASLSQSEYLQRFADGPCSPTIILPGIGGSKLVAVIDCEKLREKNPKVF